MSGILRRKNLKRGVNLTLMVVGASGLGKSTFVRTLTQNMEMIPPRTVPQGDVLAQEPTLDFHSYSMEMEEDGVRLVLNVIDTPGFGDGIDNRGQFQHLLLFLEQQYDEVLLEETRIKRNPKFQDNRVDAILYFIQPTGHALSEMDIELMKRLGMRVNIIPVIAKADSLRPAEMKEFKKRIMEDIVYHQIPVFAFPFDPSADDEETIAENRELRGMMPFSVIGAEDQLHVVQGRKVRGRAYPWGVCETDNSKHCDFARLRYVLFNSHLQDLKDITHDILYEQYRTQKLSREEHAASGDQNRKATSNPALREQVVQQAIMKEELLKNQEEKIREREIKLQQELEEKRRELEEKEQMLREMELRISESRAQTPAAPRLVNQNRDPIMMLESPPENYDEN